MADSGAPLYDDVWDYADPKGTAERFRELLQEVEASGDVSALLELLTQLARTQSLQGNFEQAHEILDRAQAMSSDEMTIPRIRYLLERGRSFNSAGEAQRALPLFLQVWDLARDAGERFYAIDAAHMLGIAEASPEAQLAWSVKAMEMAEQSRNPRTRQWLGPLLNNIGWSYHDAGRYEEALSLFEKSLRWREDEAAPRKPVPIRIAKWTVGRALRSLGRLEEALATQEALLAEWEAAGGQSGYVFEELGECLLALSREDEARPYFAQAYELLVQDQWLASNEEERMRRLKSLGEAA